MMKNAPLVSIIMNCYNGEQFLQEAINSVYGQSYANWEIIFWDNASTDNSSSIAKSYDERIRYHLASKTTSLGEARNFALNKASGIYVAFLDCDDIYLTDKLEQQVKFLGLESRVTFTGWIDGEQKGDLLKRADVFCLPSYREGFGVVIIEAASVGLPAIASRIYGITDAVDEGVTGIQCRYGC